MRAIIKDKYVLAMEYLHAHWDEVTDAWIDGGRDGHPSGPLFAYAGDAATCGCLTTVRGCGQVAATPELTDEIRSDERIPEYCADIRPEHLNVFAEWQRRLDKELGRGA